VVNGSVDQVVFIDDGVADPGLFLQGAAAGTEVVRLDSHSNALQLISQTLAAQHNLAAVQILSHGRAAALELGGTSLDLTALNEAAPQVASWGKALAPAGDLLLWGCDVAAGPDGRAFVNRLGALTGAAVAASTDLTGSAALGGDWNLEYHTGPIMATAPWSAATLAKYRFTLPAPANDNVENAEVIPPGPFPLQSTVTADITGATDLADDPVPLAAPGNVSHSIWYTFTPTTTAHYSFTTDNPPTGTTVPDTVLGIFTGPAHGPYKEFASNDDTVPSTTTTSTAECDMIAGQQYWIVAWEKGFATPGAGATAIQLRVSQTLLPAAPANDQPAGAVVIPPSGPFPYQSPVTADITGATRSATDPVPSCQPNVSKSIWYSFTPTVTATYAFRTGNPPAATTVPDTVIGVYTGPVGGPYTELTCDDNGDGTGGLQSMADADLTAGSRYWVVVFQSGTKLPTAGQAAVQLRVEKVPTPPNDTAAGALPLTLNIPLQGTTVGAHDDYELPSGSGIFTGVGQTSSTARGRDVVYTFTAPATGGYSFRIAGYSTAQHPVLYVASSAPTGPAPQMVTSGMLGAYRNTSRGSLQSSGSQEVVDVSLTAGQTVDVFVDDNNAMNNGSAFTLEVNPSVVETDPNNFPSLASPYTFGLEGSLSSGGDKDYFQLGTPPTGSRVFAMIDGVAANSDDTFDLRVTTQTDTLEYDDGDANSANFGAFAPSIAGTSTTGVATYLQVSSFGGTTAIGPYRLYAVVQPDSGSATLETTSAHNTLATAQSATNNYFSGTLSGAGVSSDHDLYSFTAQAGDEIFLSLDCNPSRGSTPIDGSLTLLDYRGNPLIVADNSNNVNDPTVDPANLNATTPNSPSEGMVYRVRTAGTYYALVQASPKATATNGHGDYLLSISKNGQLGGGGSDTVAPAVAGISAPTLTAGGNHLYMFNVTYTDNVAVDPVTLSNTNLVVNGPHAYSQSATFVGANPNTPGASVVATYSIPAPPGGWATSTNGSYTIHLNGGQVGDTATPANTIPAGDIGTFTVAIDAVPPVVTHLTAPPLTSSATNTYQLSVTFTDNVAVLVSSLGNGQVRVTGPNSFNQLATFVSVDNATNGTPRTATYQITSPGANWVSSNNGTYTVSLIGGQVSDVDGNFAAAATIGTFSVNVDTIAPTVSGAFADVTTPFVTTYDFQVAYSDNVAINISTLGSNNIRVLGPNSFNQPAALVPPVPTVNGSPVTVTYRLTVPGGGWQNSDNGTYQVVMQPNQVSDTGTPANFVAAGTIGTFQVSVDTTVPTAIASAPNVTTGLDTTEDLTVIYSDNTAIDVSTLDNNDVRVLGPNNFDQPASFVSVDTNTNGTPRTATYRLTVPNGWQTSDNGNYLVVMQANQVFNTDMPPKAVASSTLATFIVNVDTIAPTASASAPDVTVGLTTTEDLTVTYSDDAAIDVSTMDSGDLHVTGPSGFDQPVSFIGVATNTNGTPRTATYRLTVPNGWHTKDNGTYQIMMQANEVSDTGTPANFVAAGAIGSFMVNVDTVAPSAVANTTNVTSSLSPTYDFTVTYTDNVAIDATTLGDTNVRIMRAGPGGFDQPATLVPPAPGANGSPLTVTYRLTVPNGGWHSSDNGTYLVVMQANQVFDTATPPNPVATADLGMFTVAIDSVAPTAQATFSNIMAGFGTGYSFTVTYTDNIAVNVSSLDNNDILVTGPNGFSQPAMFVGVDTNSNGTPRTATYRISAPGGAWTSAANGAYTVAVQPGQVTDTATPPNPVAAGVLGTFNVMVDTIPPTATVTAQAGSTNALPVVFNVAFSEPVTGFSSGSVVVGGTAGGNSVVVSGGGANYTVAVTRVSGSGTVTLTLPAGAAMDLAGNASLASALTGTTFNADVTAFVKVTPARPVRRGGGFLHKVTLKNIGNFSIPAPLSLIFDSLAKGVKLKKGGGTTKGPGGKNSPFVVVPLTQGVFAPGTSINVTVTFTAPSANKVKYKPRLVFGSLPM
jgi:hypothetical protein